MTNFRNKACPKSIIKKSSLIAKQKTVFDASRSIGKLEFLNDFGQVGGTVRNALDELAKTSDVVRTSGSVNEDDDILDEDGSGLMSRMELGEDVQAAVASFDPNAVNSAVGASKALVARARQGNFRIDDIASFTAEFKNIAQIAGSILTDPQSGSGRDQSDYERFRCLPSPYAVDLVYKQPKQNFQFIVEIVLSAPYRQQFSLPQFDRDEEVEAKPEILKDSDGNTVATRTSVNKTSQQLTTQLAFLIKSSSRPAPSYEYEDLNYYNYRTKGIRRATFNPVTMTFIDDQLNSAAAFYAFYISAMSPIVNMGVDPTKAADLQNYEHSGMDYADPTSSRQGIAGQPNTFPAYSATIGAKRAMDVTNTNNTKSILDRISIYQFGRNANTLSGHHMYNPRIMTFTPSEVTMAESGEGQTLAMEIDYDYFTIQPEIKIDSEDFGNEKLAAISGGLAGATYPIMHWGDGISHGNAYPEAKTSATEGPARIGSSIIK